MSVAETTSPAPDDAVLDVRGLQVELMTDAGIIRAVDGVSFRIAPGETVTIIGESGSGKSTTAMGLLRLLPADLAVLSGSATLLGEELIGDRGAQAAKMRGRDVALIPQDPMTALIPVRTIGWQLAGAIRVNDRRLGRAEVTARSVELLEHVRIPTPAAQLKKYPHQLSGGMLQRVLIAMALAARPSLLVADEPTSALDVTVQAGILDLLLELQEDMRLGILMITHDLGVARIVSDRIHVMKDGRFVESGEVEQIVSAPREEYTRKLLAAVPQLGDWDGGPGADQASAPGDDQASEARVEERAGGSARVEERADGSARVEERADGSAPEATS